MHLKKGYKKFHLKGMQKVSEDALKKLIFHFLYNTFAVSVQCCKATVCEVKCGLWVSMICCLYKVQTLQKGITTGQLLVS